MDAWNADRVTLLLSTYPAVVRVQYLTKDDADVLMDVHDEALRRLGVETTAQYVSRPDGHVGFRCAGTDLGGASEYLRRWFTPTGPLNGHGWSGTEQAR